MVSERLKSALVGVETSGKPVGWPDFNELALSTAGIEGKELKDLKKTSRLFQEMVAAEGAGVPLAYYYFLRKLYTGAEVPWRSTDTKLNVSDLLANPSQLFGDNTPLMLQLGYVVGQYTPQNWNAIRLAIPQGRLPEPNTRRAKWCMPELYTSTTNAGERLLELLGLSFQESSANMADAAFHALNVEPALWSPGALTVGNYLRLAAFNCLAASPEDFESLRLPDRFGGQLTIAKLSALNSTRSLFQQQ